MRHYTIDELRPADYDALKAYFDEHVESGGLSGIYRFPISEGVLSDLQSEHKDCQPYFVMVDLGEDKCSCELLVRTKKSMTCHCVAMATEKQKIWLMSSMDSIFEKLGLIF